MRTILQLALPIVLMLAACAPAAPRVDVAPTAPPVQVASTPAPTTVVPIQPTPLPAPTAAPTVAAPAASQPTPLPTPALASAAPAESPLEGDPGVGAAAPPVAAPPQTPEPIVEGVCELPPQPPLPVPGSSGASSIWSAYRVPMAPRPVYNPPGPKRVGLQAGHWKVEETPPELRSLGGGAVGGGKAEWEVNLDLAQRTADLLRAAGVQVDILPATVPIRYRAHLFLSIHADGDESGRLQGYKLARAAWSAVPEADDRLLAAVYQTYGEATGMPRDDEHISRRMTAYYAFNSRRYCHAVAPDVPAAILETGFLTSAVDRRILLGNPQTAAVGIARGVLRFLGLPE